ncbi:dTDP-4-dehydrorhamnose reductase [Xylanimonas ulmi]|uniref:dTDP-4-dehydrorhamnose reductase n=1 Tax=Xylanimonas ulmi TaxID=228973 RepID=A0A4Q7LXY7_9MICO|nr:dTDP-4-dehydrorhamnose reductase [Xylanibacterium ulmi]RZS59975.1 dTDP-4-dehydrorhamnose reductase [Xylanibacterium ulmi]
MNTSATPSSVTLSGRWLVVGAHGMLGQDMVAAARAAGAEVDGVDRQHLDITDAAAALAGVRGYDVVVNCAAWTAVDAAEDQEAAAFAVNAVGAQNLARAAAATGARIVQISTDYVFEGHGSEPYVEDAPMAPVSAYGRTKAAGEWAVRASNPDHLVVRTAWLYGAGGPNFPKTMARLGAERDVLTVVDDQQGQPTWTVDLADLIVRLVAAGAPSGTYHGTASGVVTWNGFAQAVMAAAGLGARVEPVSSAAFAAKAPRPAYSVLGHDALRAVGVAPIGDWAERWKAAAASVLA